MTKLGNHFRLFRGANFNSGICIISSHGGQVSVSTTETFKTPIKVGFYQTRGESLTASLNTGLSMPTEIIAVGYSLEDYYLSKFQGKHGDIDETYSAIKKFVDSENVAILTLRNRKSWFVKGKKKVLFSDALGYLEKGGFGISQVNCLFCRVPAGVAYIPSPFLQAQGISDIIS